MADLALDLRHAVRRLTRTPGFTVLALSTLALSIGANAALFSVVEAVLLKPMPFSSPERVYAIWSRHTSTDRYPFSLPEFCDYRDENRSLEAVAGLAGWSGNLGGEGTTERASGYAGVGEPLRDAGSLGGSRPQAAPRGRRSG